MGRFRFRLAAVLRHRLSIERERQRAVAALEQERAVLEQDIRNHQQAASDEQTLGCGVLTGRVDVVAARRQGGAVARHAAAARQAALKLAGVHKKLDSARAELLAAAKRRKAVELLRDHRYQQWADGERRSEAAAQDEMVVIRHERDRLDAPARWPGEVRT